MSRRGVAAVLVGAALVFGPAASADPDDWALREGFAISAHSTGFDLPTAIAIVPRAGGKPGDVLYYVTQLRGEIKAVTRAGTIHSFATVPAFQPASEEPFAEAGLAGICLDHRRGYVFVTYAYLDDRGVLRNTITRFSVGREFSRKPVATRSFTGVFAAFQAAGSHQIGGCGVRGRSLFVGVGDGGSPRASTAKDQLLGKIVCLTVDGAPCPANPFSYVWAHGFRNPFGLAFFEGSLFAVDNGLEIDRFVRVERGGNYLWDGFDASIGARADAVFAPSISPVQLAYYPQREGRARFPSTYARSFYAAVAGNLEVVRDAAGVLRIPFDGDRQRVSGVPVPFVQYRGEEEQAVTGVAFGPDGLYFVPLFPDTDGRSSVYRVSYDAGSAHSHIIGRDDAGSDANELMREKGCFSCHELAGRGGGIGPSLDPMWVRDRLRSRLPSKEYAQFVARLSRLTEEPYSSYRDERASILEKSGNDQIAAWIKYKLLEPRFDDPNATMPKLGLTPDEAEKISSFFLEDELRRPSFADRLRARKRPIAAGFVAGALSVIALLGLWKIAVGSRRRRTQSG